MLLHTIQKYPQNTALKMKKGDSYQTYTYQEMGAEIELVTNALVKLGLRKGDKIAILSNNRPE